MPYRSPLLDVPGSIPPPDSDPAHPEAGVPWHWGDPFAEQRTATRGVVVIDRSHREFLAVTGEERLSWLHLVISQHVTGLAEGTGTEALVLDSQGRVEAHMVLAHLDGTVWLDTDPDPAATSALPKGGKQTLHEYFEAMKFWSKVDIRSAAPFGGSGVAKPPGGGAGAGPREDTATSELALLTVIGPDAERVLGAVGVSLGQEPYTVAALPGGTGFARRMPWPGRSSVDLAVPRAELADWWRRLTDAGARAAGSWTFDALRVESLRPRLGIDTDERTIPHEAGWVDSAAHVAKGCYRGQETVSKVHNVGRPPRNLLLLHLDGSPDVTPETGDPVLLDGRAVGRVGTVIQHHELGPIALALIKRSVPVGAELLVGQEDALVQAAIDPDSVPVEHAAPGRAAASQLRG